MRGQDATEERAHVRVVACVVLLHHLSQPGVVPLVRRLPRLPLAQLGIGLGHLGEPAKDEVGLDRQRFLAPERAVVVEHRDPFFRRIPVRGHALDELEHGGLGGAVVPGRASGSAMLSGPRERSLSFATTWSIVKLGAF